MNRDKSLAFHIISGMVIGIIVGFLLKNIGVWVSIGVLAGVARYNYVFRNNVK